MGDTSETAGVLIRTYQFVPWGDTQGLVVARGVFSRTVSGYLKPVKERECLNGDNLEISLWDKDLSRPSGRTTKVKREEARALPRFLREEETKGHSHARGENRIWEKLGGGNTSRETESSVRRPLRGYWKIICAKSAP